MTGLLGYRNYRQMLYAYGGILLMSLVAYLVRSAKFEEFGQSLQIKLFFLSVVFISFLWESLRFINRYLNEIMPFENGIPQRVIAQLVLGSLFGLFVRALIYFFGEPYLPFKLDELFIAATWVLYILVPAGMNLGFFTVEFIERWKASLILAEKLEKEKSQVQFDNLRNQLNPHFLFNALTSLNSLIFEDQQLASDFLQQLSKVYRYVLKNKDRTIVSLETELNFIRHYVSLLQTRFGDSLTIRFDIPESARQKAIVPVTLQILIENALKHNVVDQAKPLHITITATEEYLEVGNNLQIRKRVEESNKQGLENLKSLYKFLTSKPVIVEEAEGRFFVRVPLV